MTATSFALDAGGPMMPCALPPRIRVIQVSICSRHTSPTQVRPRCRSNCRRRVVDVDAGRLASPHVRLPGQELLDQFAVAVLWERSAGASEPFSVLVPPTLAVSLTTVSRGFWLGPSR